MGSTDASPLGNAQDPVFVSSDYAPSTGFKSFWKRSGRTPEEKDVTFVQQDPSTRTKSGRISRLFKQESSSSKPPKPTGQDTAQKRRDQVYEAQKRHRNRKAEYVQTLEAELAQFQHLDSVANSEKNALLHENQAIRALLASHGIAAPAESLFLPTTSPTGSSPDILSPLDVALIDIRYDPDLGHERTFMDFTFDDLTSSNTSGTTPNTNPTPITGTATTSAASDTTEQVSHLLSPPASPPNDSWAALDFILALEWPCRGHINHPSINPPEPSAPGCGGDGDGSHGHALTATAAVYSHALPPTPAAANAAAVTGAAVPGQGLPLSSREKWQLPHSEIDKLIALSDQLELDDEILTPAQAYSAVRNHVAPRDDLLRPTLEALKVPLSLLCGCRGFGAVMPAEQFWLQLYSVVDVLTKAS